MNSFSLEVITPDTVAFSGPVSRVSVPSTTGQLGILPRHISLFAVLDAGEVIVSQTGQTTSIAIGGGFVQGTPSHTVILVSRAQHADHLNETEFQSALARAKEALAKKPAGAEYISAAASLHQSLTDLKIIRRLKKRHL